MIVLYWVVGVIAYLGIAVKAARFSVRSMGAYMAREGFKDYGIEDDELAFHLYFALLWPISTPVIWLSTTPKPRLSALLRKLLIR